MRIGIDVSQLAYQNTGVANYLQHLVLSMVNDGKQHEYVLFFSSLRGSLPREFIEKLPPSVIVRKYKLPPTVLDLLWNKLHIWSIEQFVGNVDIFLSSDWSQPPTRLAKSATIIYDLVIFKYPQETHDQTSFQVKNLQLKSNIVSTQRRRLKWVKKECDVVFCISKSTMEDVHEILKIPNEKLYLAYPGITK